MLERPAQSELQSAIRKLEQLGEYQTYFGNNPDAVVGAQVPHYQEYNYLHNIVTATQVLVDHYDDSAWLENHHVTDQTFQDALEEMQHAYRGCSLIFGVNRTTETKAEASEISNTTNASSSHQTTTTPAVTTQTTTSGKKSVKAETFTPATSQVAQSTSVTPAQTQDNTTNQATTPADNTVTEVAEEIAVPATGNVETSPRQVSWPALIAVVIAGAVVASIAITLIIRHEPRRASTARSRYHR